MNKLLQPTTYNLLLRVIAGLLPVYVVRFSVFYIPTNLFEVLVACALVYGVCLPEVRRSWRDGFFSIPRAIKIWAGLFLISAHISTFISKVPYVSLGILKGWIVIPMLFGFVVHSAVKTQPAMRKRIVDSLICSGVVVACLGIAQIGSYDRVRSLYDVPNSLALFLVPLAVIASWVGYMKNSRVYQLSAGVMLVAILAAQSAGAVVALIGTLGFAVVTSRKTLSLKRTKIAYFALIALPLIALAIFIATGRLAYLISPLVHPGATNSVTVRLQLWGISTRLIHQHPLLGIGLGQFEPAYQAELHQLFSEQGKSSRPIVGLQSEFVIRDPHNWILSFWLNLGILGLMSFVALNYLVVRKLRSVQREKEFYAEAIILSLVSLLVFGLFDTSYWKNDLSVLWWVLLGVLLL